ncbi:hypothetical protein C8R42DRAFT_584982, partial [Lentinula raphanica]
WFADAFSYLNIDLGPQWREVVTTWVEFERVFGWAKTPSHHPRAFPALLRPKELSHWIGNCRYERKGSEPVFDDLSFVEFIDKFWNWWASIQPEWRGLDMGSRPAPVSCYGSDWKTLNIHGKNGWLSVLACLKWWGVYIGNDGGERRQEWLKAVRDVHVMLTGLVDHVRT